MVALSPVAAYVGTALKRVWYPYELTYFEGSTVEVTGRVVAGEPLYAAPTTAYTPWPYPPLYSWLTGGVAHLTGGLTIASLRVVSFAASLVVLVLLAVVVRRTGGSWLPGLVAAGLYAATYRVSGAWADTARVDSLLLALLLAAALVGLRARTWRGGVALGAVLLLAFLTKQNALLVAVPVLGWLLVRRRSVGVAASMTLALTAVTSMVVGDAVTDGWYSQYVGWQLLGQGLAAQWLWEFWVVDLALPFAVSLAVTGWLVRRLRPDRPPGPDASYLLAVACGLVMAAWAGRLHDGGFANVAMPAHAAAAMLLGLGLATVLRHPSMRGTTVLAVLAVGMAVQVVVMAVWRLDVVPTDADRAAGTRLVARLRTLPTGVVVASHPYYLRLAGRPVHASAIAIADVLRGGPGRARDALQAALPWSLRGVSSVILDSPADATLFGGALPREFRLVDASLVPDGLLVPRSDVPTRPQLLYERVRPPADG